jgi:hypothetical protein
LLDTLASKLGKLVELEKQSTVHLRLAAVNYRYSRTGPYEVEILVSAGCKHHIGAKNVMCDAKKA